MSLNLLDEYSIDNLQHQLGTCLVIGGSGWVGSYLVHQLLQLSKSQYATAGKNNISVHSADIVEPIKELAIFHSSSDILHHRINICNRNEVKVLINKVRPNTVFHLASCIDLRSIPSPSLESVNVKGTMNVLEESISLENFSGFADEEEFRYLVYTSSIDVVSSTFGVKDANEKSPYSENPSNDYKRTKIIAEELVLSYNNHKSTSSTKTLRTSALRPAHIFGPADRVFELASQCPVAVGGEDARMSFIYVENCARAHVLMAAKMMRETLLENEKSKCKLNKLSLYHENPSLQITNICGAPLFVHDFDENFCDFYKFLSGKKPCKIRIPLVLLRVVLFIVVILEKVAFTVFGVYLQHPITGMTSGVLEACCTLTVKTKLAANSINYSPSKQGTIYPILSKEESIRRTLLYISTGKITTKN